MKTRMNGHCYRVARRIGLATRLERPTIGTVKRPTDPSADVASRRADSREDVP